MRKLVLTTAAVAAAICLVGCLKKVVPLPIPETQDTLPVITYDTLSDERDGQKYLTVKIGGQTWTAQNLNYKTTSESWMIRSWCYNNDTSYCEKYGRLYTWEAAITACPNGMHLPTAQEWDDLVKTAGGKRQIEDGDIEYGHAYWLGAGNKLKAKRGWDDDDRNGTDDYGFSALPGGYREYLILHDIKHDFGDAGGFGHWWTDTETNSDFAYHRYMGYGDGHANRTSYKGKGYSVRCVADGAHGNVRTTATAIGLSLADEPSFGTLSDTRDGQTYRTVKIGGQTWMAQNMNYQTDSSWCYGNNIDSCKKYGRLYAWSAAMAVCQSIGWRLPDTADWRLLLDAAGNSADKLISKTGWYSRGNGADTYGFSALPGGLRSCIDGDFVGAGNAYWWTATERRSHNAYSRFMYHTSNIRMYNYDFDKSTGLSVRCVADPP